MVVSGDIFKVQRVTIRYLDVFTHDNQQEVFNILDPEVINYLKKQYDKGHDLETVEKVLLKSGYDKTDVEHAINEIRDAGDKKDQKKKIEKKTKVVQKRQEALPLYEEKKEITAQGPADHDKLSHDPKRHRMGFFSKLSHLLFNIDRFIDGKEWNLGFLRACLFYFGTFFMILPLLLIIELIYYGTFQAGAQSRTAGLAMTIVTFLVGDISLFFALTIGACIALLLLHAMGYLLGARGGISKTYQAFFYGTSPMVLFLWLIPLLPVFLVFAAYSFFANYELFRVFHALDRRQAIMSMVLSLLVIMVIGIIVVLSFSPLLSEMTLRISLVTKAICSL